MSNNIDLKRTNQNEVFRYIYFQNHPVSKYDLMKNLDLSLPTVNMIIKYFTENHYLYDCGTFDSQGGRPPKAFTYNTSLRHAIGLDITQHHIHIVITDLSGSIIAKKKIRQPFTADDSYYVQLSNAVESMITSTGIEKDSILGIGIALPVMVNFSKQITLHSNLTVFKDISIEKFVHYLHFPCMICNDANAGGLAEQWNNREMKNAFYLSLNNTVGGAILQNHRLYFGETYESGEIGHVTLVNNGRLCYCGKHGCVDAYISALILSNSAGGSLDAFFKHIDEGSTYHINIWNEYLEYLTITINNLKMLFDCSVIAGGYVGPYLEKHTDTIKKLLIQRNTYHEEAEYFKICKFKRYSTAVGAALLNIEKFLKTV